MKGECGSVPMRYEIMPKFETFAQVPNFVSTFNGYGFMELVNVGTMSFG